MSKAARSLYLFAIYLVVSGRGFLGIPNIVLPMFGLPETSGP